MKFVNSNKWFIVSYLIWTFIHLVMYFNGDDIKGFWPFVHHMHLHSYDFMELFVYLTLPVLIFITIKLVGRDINKAI